MLSGWGMNGSASKAAPQLPRPWAAVRPTPLPPPPPAHAPSHRFASGPHAGESVVEVMLEDPEFVLDAEDPSFDASLRGEADELRREVVHLRLPRAEDGSDVAVFYFRMPDGAYGGMAMVPVSSPLLPRYASRAAARTDGFVDLRVPRTIAPDDDRGTAFLMHAFVHHVLGERLTWREYVEVSREGVDWSGASQPTA